MSFKPAQEEVDAWVQQYTVPYWQPHEILARVTEEVGELAREVNHMYGPKKKKSTEDNNDLALELGDIMFSVICFANSQKIDLDAVFKQVMDKCYGRDKDRFEKK